MTYGYNETTQEGICHTSGRGLLMGEFTFVEVKWSKKIVRTSRNFQGMDGLQILK